MRRKDREVTNIIEILQIIEKAKVLHLALFDADYPCYEVTIVKKRLKEISVSRQATFVFL